MSEMTIPYNLRCRGLYDTSFRNPHTFRQQLAIADRGCLVQKTAAAKRLMVSLAAHPGVISHQRHQLVAS